MRRSTGPHEKCPASRVSLTGHPLQSRTGDKAAAPTMVVGVIDGGALMQKCEYHSNILVEHPSSSSCGMYSFPLVFRFATEFCMS